MSVKTITCKLHTDGKASVVLADTMHLFSEVANHLSEIVWTEKIFRQFDLHKKAYHAVRGSFPALPSQLVVRAIRVVTDSYKMDRSVKHAFGERSAVVFDARCFKLRGVSSAILTTTQGRLTLSLAHGGKQRQMLEGKKIGEADLLFRGGNYYLAISITLPDLPPKDVVGVLGVDVGLSQIATDNEGETFTGEPVKALRRKCRRIRSLLQKKGTKNAKRHLQKIRHRQRHFVATLNHQIAKRIVQKALNSAKAIAMEILTNIPKRGNGFGRELRWLLGNWSFDDLQRKICYKAKDLGIPIIWIGPAYTSQTCSCCGHCERSNRKSQSHFECNRCGFCANADVNAAINIGTRAVLSTCLLKSVA